MSNFSSLPDLSSLSVLAISTRQALHTAVASVLSPSSIEERLAGMKNLTKKLLQFYHNQHTNAGVIKLQTRKELFLGMLSVGECVPTPTLTYR